MTKRIHLEATMFHSPAEAMAYSLKASRLLLHRFLQDLKPHEYEHQPMPGANCTSWILGHLILTDRRQLGWLGATELPPLPEWFSEAAFQTTRTIAGSQSGYGDPKGLLELFDTHRQALIDFLPKVEPSVFGEPPTLVRPMFQDRGEATLFMGLHTSMHLGQISLIRRSLGYPPLS